MTKAVSPILFVASRPGRGDSRARPGRGADPRRGSTDDSRSLRRSRPRRGSAGRAALYGRVHRAADSLCASDVRGIGPVMEARSLPRHRAFLGPCPGRPGDRARRHRIGSPAAPACRWRAVEPAGTRQVGTSRASEQDASTQPPRGRHLFTGEGQAGRQQIGLRPFLRLAPPATTSGSGRGDRTRKASPSREGLFRRLAATAINASRTLGHVLGERPGQRASSEQPRLSATCHMVSPTRSVAPQPVAEPHALDRLAERGRRAERHRFVPGSRVPRTSTPPPRFDRSSVDSVRISIGWVSASSLSPGG